jgi:hypothetical protein
MSARGDSLRCSRNPASNQDAGLITSGSDDTRAIPIVEALKERRDEFVDPYSDERSPAPWHPRGAEARAYYDCIGDKAFSINDRDRGCLCASALLSILFPYLPQSAPLAGQPRA